MWCNICYFLCKKVVVLLSGNGCVFVFGVGFFIQFFCFMVFFNFFDNMLFIDVYFYVMYGGYVRQWKDVNIFDLFIGVIFKVLNIFGSYNQVVNVGFDCGFKV